MKKYQMNKKISVYEEESVFETNTNYTNHSFFKFIFSFCFVFLHKKVTNIFVLFAFFKWIFLILSFRVYQNVYYFRTKTAILWIIWKNRFKINVFSKFFLLYQWWILEIQDLGVWIQATQFLYNCVLHKCIAKSAGIDLVEFRWRWNRTNFEWIRFT